MEYGCIIEEKQMIIKCTFNGVIYSASISNLADHQYLGEYLGEYLDGNTISSHINISNNWNIIKTTISNNGTLQFVTKINNTIFTCVLENEEQKKKFKDDLINNMNTNLAVEVVRDLFNKEIDSINQKLNNQEIKDLNTNIRFLNNRFHMLDSEIFDKEKINKITFVQILIIFLIAIPTVVSGGSKDVTGIYNEIFKSIGWTLISFGILFAIRYCKELFELFTK